LSIERITIELQLMEALVQHLLYAGLQTRQKRSDVLNQNVIQGLCQVVQAAMCCHTAVLWVCTEEVQLCSSCLPYVPATDDVLLTAIHHPCKGDSCVQPSRLTRIALMALAGMMNATDSKNQSAESCHSQTCVESYCNNACYSCCMTSTQSLPRRYAASMCFLHRSAHAFQVTACRVLGLKC